MKTVKIGQWKESEWDWGVEVKKKAESTNSRLHFGPERCTVQGTQKPPNPTAEKELTGRNPAGQFLATNQNTKKKILPQQHANNSKFKLTIINEALQHRSSILRHIDEAVQKRVFCFVTRRKRAVGCLIGRMEKVDPKC